MSEDLSRYETNPTGATPAQQAILLAVSQSEQKMTAMIEACTRTIQASITQLTEAHHTAVLTQERRNSEFARSDRVEIVAARVHDHGNDLTKLTLRQEQFDKALKDISDQLSSIERAFTSRSLDLFGGLASWAGMAVVMFGCALLTWYLTTHMGPVK